MMIEAVIIGVRMMVTTMVRFQPLSILRRKIEIESMEVHVARKIVKNKPGHYSTHCSPAVVSSVPHSHQVLQVVPVTATIVR